MPACRNLPSSALGAQPARVSTKLSTPVPRQRPYSALYWGGSRSGTTGPARRRKPGEGRRLARTARRGHGSRCRLRSRTPCIPDTPCRIRPKQAGIAGQGRQLEEWKRQQSQGEQQHPQVCRTAKLPDPPTPSRAPMPHGRTLPRRRGAGQRSKLLLKVPDGAPYGIRTRVTALKGPCPRPLDERDHARTA